MNKLRMTVRAAANGRFDVTNSNGVCVAEDLELDEADLIAAAPDLLAALLKVIDSQYIHIKNADEEAKSPGYYANRVYGVSSAALAAANIAVAKATGGQS